MNIFISHIHEEAELAKFFKEWIENSFVTGCDVFVSSNAKSLTAGDNWLNKIGEAIADTNVLIILCSEMSITRPWINFECGCGWVNNKKIIPLCHSGMKFEALPVPINLFTGFNIEDKEFSKTFINHLSQIVAKGKAPRIDFKLMETELDAIMAKTKLESKPTKMTKVGINNDLDETEMKILEYFGKIGNYTLRVKHLEDQFSLSYQKAQYYLDSLRKEQLIDFSMTIGGPIEYYLTGKGRERLFKLGKL